MVPPVAGLFVVLQAALWIGAAIVLRGGGRRWRSVAALAALTMLAYLPATYLARLIDFYDASRPGAYWVFVFAVAIAMAVAGDVDRASAAASIRCSSASARSSGCSPSTCSSVRRSS